MYARSCSVPANRMQKVRKIFPVVLFVGLSGCAVYAPEPLPSAPDLDSRLPTKDAEVPPGQALSMAQIAAVAVNRSPDLAAVRRKADVSQAQAQLAGLLPDPQLSASGDHPTVHGVGLTNAYALGLAEDLQGLLTYPSRASGAEAAADQAKLDLLWNEWQTIQMAGTLYAQKVFADQKSAQMQKIAALLETQARRSQNALAAGDTTLDVAGADISTALDQASLANQAARAALTADSGLKMLLGLTSDAPLALAALPDPKPLTKDDVAAALKTVAKARPDLLALQAGYHAQEEQVRSAILQQFPAVSLGFVRSSDTTNVQTNGLSLTMNLPLFGSTQANIAVQRATRAQLYAEYQARLDQTENDAWRLFDEIALLQDEIARLEAQLPQFEKMGATGQQAYEAGNLPASTYVVLQTSLGARESELYDLKTQLWTDAISLRALVGMEPIIPAAK